ncbi:MAG: PorV/PorQ family protein [candidate division Zixibacteria bacterium]|nr:PorV/PorQ family protein [candidate division Zixibacteria bacterium]
MIRTLLTISVAAVILLGPVRGVAGDAGTESLFSIGLGARALGMGGGFTSLADDAAAVYYNPAALPYLEYHEISFMHTELFEGTTYNCASWAYPLIGAGGFGLGYMRIGTGDIIKTRDFVEIGEFDFANSQFLVAYGRKLEGGFSAGLTLKVVNQSVDNLSDYGVGLDLGLRSQLTANLSAGLIVRDMIPATIKLHNMKENLPTSIAGGLALRALKLSGYTVLSGSVDLEKTEERSMRLHAGAEMVFHGAYALRGGYDRDNLSFGAGYYYRRLKLDYAYKVMDYVEDSHRFSLSLLIGSSVSEQMQQKEREALERGTELLEDERQSRFVFFKEKADTYYDQFRLDSALAYYYRALAFDDENQEIIGTIAAIKRAVQVEQEQRDRIAKTRVELDNLIENFQQQAQSFFNKRYYSASLDMVELILGIDKNHLGAKRLQAAIHSAIAEEIATYIARGRTAEREGRYFDAIDAYNRVLELDPANQEIRQAKQDIATGLDLAQQLNTGIEMYRAGRYNEARTRFETVLSVDRNQPVALEYIGRINKLLAAPSTLEDLQRDREIWPLYIEGLRYMRDRQYQKAIDAWQKVLEAYPNNTSTLNNIEQARLRMQSETGN